MKQIMLFLFCLMSITLIANSISEIEQLKREAAQGDAYSQTRLAFLYLSEDGDFKNIQRGLELLKKAAENKNSDAQGFLASIYYSGEFLNKKDVVRKNYITARYWAERAAEAEHHLGYEILAKLYNEGLGDLPQNSTLAKYYFTKSWEKRNGVKAEIENRHRRMFKSLFAPPVEAIRTLYQKQINALKKNDFRLYLQCFSSHAKQEFYNNLRDSFIDGVTGINNGAEIRIVEVQYYDQDGLHMFMVTSLGTNKHIPVLERKMTILVKVIFEDGEWRIFEESVL